ncbi:VOC family protein [Fulvivirgaceae bacterium BMA10]|uniref:VOC family protein n=1 Tax=Splendidivirga corallicola TaxID=3051826 RepID=A0ABT8KKR9_9BACT|nr:VOC family protein [Fulvivirgaceae bacterium BMA10]
MENSFHLSLAVKEYLTSKRFYGEILGGIVERETETWFNVNLYGHQVTLHEAPEKIIKNDYFHWGINLDWKDFFDLYDRLKDSTRFKLQPEIQDEGEPQERVKMIFHDPNDYLLEFKAYKNKVDQF